LKSFIHEPASQSVDSHQWMPPRLIQAFISCRLDYCNSLLYGISDGLLNASSRCRTLPLAWSQAPVVVTTSCQCCGSCTDCQFVSESRSRSPGSCTNRLLMTVIFCLMLVIVRWGLIPTTSGSCSCQEHTTNLATGVSWQLVLDCGTIFHPDGSGRDFPSILSDDLWKNTSLWQLKRLVSLPTYRRYINKCIYLSIYSM